MSEFEYKPDPDAVHYEFRARQLVPRLQSLRDAIFAIKEEAFDIAKQQWAKSQKDAIIGNFALLDTAVHQVEDNLALVMYLVRELKTNGHKNQNVGISEMDT